MTLPTLTPTPVGTRASTPAVREDDEPGFDHACDARGGDIVFLPIGTLFCADCGAWFDER